MVRPSRDVSIATDQHFGKRCIELSQPHIVFEICIPYKILPSHVWEAKRQTDFGVTSQLLGPSLTFVHCIGERGQETSVEMVHQDCVKSLVPGLQKYLLRDVKPSRTVLPSFWLLWVPVMMMSECSSVDASGSRLLTWLLVASFRRNYLRFASRKLDRLLV
jgi:hypothetical protein